MHGLDNTHNTHTHTHTHTHTDLRFSFRYDNKTERVTKMASRHLYYMRREETADARFRLQA